MLLNHSTHDRLSRAVPWQAGHETRTFSHSAGARHAIVTKLGVLMEEIRTIFWSPETFFDLNYSLAAEGVRTDVRGNGTAQNVCLICLQFVFLYDQIVTIVVVSGHR